MIDTVIDSKQGITEGFLEGTIVTLQVVADAACVVRFEVTNDKTESAEWVTYATSTLTTGGSDTLVTTSTWQRMRYVVVSGSPTFVGVCSR